jgi:hypothetical protein
MKVVELKNELTLHGLDAKGTESELSQSISTKLIPPASRPRTGSL